MLPVAEWLEIDRYALAMTREMATRTQADYDRYEYHPIVARLQTFASEDLGAFYLDILKDRLYTTKPDSKERRSAQCALYSDHRSVAEVNGAAALVYRRRSVESFEEENRRHDFHRNVS